MNMQFSKDDIDVDEERKARTSWSLKGLRKRFSNKKHKIGSLPDLEFAIYDSKYGISQHNSSFELSVNEDRTVDSYQPLLRPSIVNPKRKQHCLSLDENILNSMMHQPLLHHSKCGHYCKSTNAMYIPQDQNFSHALHTSELCQIALEINSQFEDEFSVYKDRLNCSCAKKKYHSWPKYANKHFKYHNYGLKDYQDDFVGQKCVPDCDVYMSRCSASNTRVSFSDDYWHNEHTSKFSASNVSILKEKSLSQPCLFPMKSETSLKSLSSIELQDPKYQRERCICFEDNFKKGKKIVKETTYKTKSHCDLSNEFKEFDEMYRSVFNHENIADLLRGSGPDEEELFLKDNNREKYNSILHHVRKDRHLYDLQNTASQHIPEITNLKRYESLVFSDTVETNSVSSFNDDHTSDSGFGRLSDLSPLFNCLQIGIEAPLFKKRTDLMLQWFSDFSDEQKNIFIQRVLGVSSLQQMHMLSLKMENRLHEGCPINCRDMLQWLPANVAYQILDYLDPLSLSNASKVNRTWYNYAVHNHLWQKFCRSPDYKLSSVRHREQILKHTNIDGVIQWRDVFIERHCLRKNWMDGTCKVKTFVGHTQGVSCVQFDSQRIVSGSSDKTIMVWDLTSDSNLPVLTLVGHSGTVRCLQLIGNRLVSGSADNTIKVWDLSVGSDWNMAACRVTMVGHLDTVRCLQVDEEKVISGSYDKTIKVWSLRTGRCKLTLRGHSGAVLCVQFDDQKIVSGSSDNTIKVWNQFTGVCLATFHGHRDAVTCLQFNHCHIISGSLDCTLKFWDLNSGKCVGTIDWIRSEGHTRVVRCLQADSWKIVSAGDDKTLKIWSLESGERFVTLHKHTDGVTCLRFDDFMIVSGSYDKTVKVWDFLP